MAQKRGFLIVFEGVDGSGKTTALRNTATLLQEAGYHNLVTTREPGGSTLGARIRQIIHHESKITITPIAEFLLFAADRAQHMHDIIIPALHENKTVLCDRMSDSSLIYQGYGKGVDREQIVNINKWVMHNIHADLTIYIRIDARTAQERVALRNNTKLTPFEQEAAQLTQRLIDGFDDLYANRTDVTIIDGSADEQTVARTCYDAIKNLVK